MKAAANPVVEVAVEGAAKPAMETTALPVVEPAMEGSGLGGDTQVEGLDKEDNEETGHEENLDASAFRWSFRHETDLQPGRRQGRAL